jgi:hypothetical protein
MEKTLPVNVYSYGPLLAITGYFYGIRHSIIGISSVLTTGISGHSRIYYPLIFPLIPSNIPIKSPVKIP